jgi:hypothetical protein
METMVQRLDWPTQDEARITTAQILEVLYSRVETMDCKQIHQACHARIVEHPSFYTARDCSIHSRMPLICFVGYIQVT